MIKIENSSRLYRNGLNTRKELVHAHILHIWIGPSFSITTLYNESAKWSTKCVNTLRSWRNKRHFADEIFKCIFWNENVWPSVQISLKFLPNVRINNIPSLVQIMAWRRPGDKPFSEPMMGSLLTHICVTRPKWIDFRMVRLIVIHIYNLA